MRKTHIFSVLVLIILMTHCVIGEEFYGLNIKNNSSATIIVCGAYILPDTLLPSGQVKIATIKPNKSSFVFDHYFEDKELKRFDSGEKLTIFIIDEQVYKSEPWDTIRKYNKILKRYELNNEDYANMGGEVNYP